MDKNWYKKSIHEIYQSFGTKKEGLSGSEASERLKRDGLNKLPDAKIDSIFLIFLRQFQSPLIYILIFASLIIFMMGELADGTIILFVLLFNAIIGAFQEGKAQNTLLALKKFSQTNATVIRDGKEIVIPDTEVVAGDVIILQEGVKIPADARVFEANNLTVDESALTGESIPVNKVENELTSDNLQISDQKNMIFKGTHVVAGNGKAVVVATGLNTFFGKISQEITEFDTEIPLKIKIRNLTRLIIGLVLVICTSIFFLGIFMGHPTREMFATVVSLSVAIVPEGLPIVLTLVLATGVWRMGKRNALVKKLQAVEALGQAKYLAVDKTGTLTENEIILRKVFINEEMFEVTGDGYKPEGNILLKNEKIDPLNHESLIMAGKMAALGSDASVDFNEELKSYIPTGDPIDAALSVFAHKVGFKKEVLEKESPRISEIPFDSKYKFHASSHEVEGKVFTTVIGAPEELLELSSKYFHKEKHFVLNAEKRKEIEKTLTEMYREGLRVVAFAIQENHEKVHIDNKLEDLVFVGFFGLRDSLRPEAKSAVEKAEAAGIKVIMITGDHKITGQRIAEEVGIFHEGDVVLTGDEIDSYSEEKFIEVLPRVSVFTRVTPDHKLKIINSFKKIGEVIAMTGDGVNDAPSLVAADLGISMGKIGTEVAKEASDIVLLDDNFASIIAAIEEGRSIYKSIKKVIFYLLTTSLGEVFTISAAILLGFPLPLLAAQIIWLNFVTEGFLVVALAMEPKEDGLLRENFEKPRKYIIDHFMMFRMITLAIPMTLGTLFLFSQNYQIDITKAWTISLTTLAVFIWFNAWNARSDTKSIFQMNPFSNKFLVIATVIVVILQLFAIYNPLMQKYLNTTALELSDWLLILPIALSIVVVEEIRKFIFRKKGQSKN